jgi:hypothetical protein
MPKAKLDHQFYMSHPQHREKVMAEYNAHYPHGPPDGQDALKQRNKITAEMLQEELSEVREALKTEAMEELEAARVRHEEAKLGLPSDVPEDIEEYVYLFFLSFNKNKSN